MSFTLNRCPDARLLWPILNTWQYLLLSAKVSCQRFKVPLSCLVTRYTTGEVSFMSSSDLGISCNIKCCDSILKLNLSRMYRVRYGFILLLNNTEPVYIFHGFFHQILHAMRRTIQANSGGHT